MLKLFARTLATTVLACSSIPAMAVDGTVLIDQNKAVSGNVTPGDAAGWPVTITQPGSYRLASNLRPPALTTAIEITTSNVTLDLNGFALIGVRADPPQFSTAIRYTGPLPAKNITIRSGVIADFTFPFNLGSTFDPNTLVTSNAAVNATIQDVSITLGFNGTAGTELGPYSRVLNVSAPGLSLNLVCPATVSYTTAYHVGADGPSAKCSFIGNAVELP
jgi:hypothetical protein